MNRKDLGKYLSNLFSFKRTKKLHIKREFKDKPTEVTVSKIKAPLFNLVPSVQTIRMAQNKKNGIALKKRIAAKKMLLFKRKEKKRNEIQENLRIG